MSVYHHSFSRASSGLYPWGQIASHVFITASQKKKKKKLNFQTSHKIELIKLCIIFIIITNITMEKKACIAMVPCPGLSHLIPLVEFAKLLVLHHNNFHVTFLIPTLGSPTPSTKSILNSLPPNIDFTILPQINIEDLPHNIHLATQMKLTVKHSLPSLHEAVTSLSSQTNLVAFVCDFFSSDALDIAKQFNLMTYVFAAASATALQFCLFFPKLDRSVSCEFMDTTKTVKIPGCNFNFKVKDFPDPVLFGRSSETYKGFLRVCQQVSFVDGVILNTFTDLEPDAIRALQQLQESDNKHSTVCVYPVGPIIQSESTSKENESECIRWLNNKPSKSVLFISFGSGGTLTHQQLNEIAFGLELSGHNFLWALRVPSKHSSSAYFSGQKGGDDDDPLEYLPLGFLERTKGKGLVVPSWAPQVEVLKHGSTGGFLTHCGWSSAVEGVVHGVPMIAWPLFAEQRMNAATITDVLKVAVRVKVDDDDEENGIIKREEVARVIKIIMESESSGEGLQLRRRIEELSVAATAALGEHGSSRRALSRLSTQMVQKINLRN